MFDTENQPIEGEVIASENHSEVAETALAVVEPSTRTDTAPQFAISLDEARERSAMLKQFCREQMVEGEDFGIIPGTKKPSLWKPGAEKLNSIFGLSPIVETVHRAVDIRGGFVEYEMKVVLIHKATGRVEAEGVGSCSNLERKYANQNAADVANTILKMAKKRALIDATLSATRASGIFTQDTEDMPKESFSKPQRQPIPNYSQRGPQKPANTSNGGDTLTDAQHRAILAIAGRVFGRHSREDDLANMVKKPLELLTRGEASGVIEQLRGMLGDT